MMDRSLPVPSFRFPLLLVPPTRVLFPPVPRPADRPGICSEDSPSPITRGLSAAGLDRPPLRLRFAAKGGAQRRIATLSHGRRAPLGSASASAQGWPSTTDGPAYYAAPGTTAGCFTLIQIAAGLDALPHHQTLSPARPDHRRGASRRLAASPLPPRLRPLPSGIRHRILPAQAPLRRPLVRSFRNPHRKKNPGGPAKTRQKCHIPRVNTETTQPGRPSERPQPPRILPGSHHKRWQM